MQRCSEFWLTFCSSLGNVDTDNAIIINFMFFLSGRKTDFLFQSVRKLFGSKEAKEQRQCLLAKDKAV